MPELISHVPVALTSEKNARNERPASAAAGSREMSSVLPGDLSRGFLEG